MSGAVVASFESALRIATTCACVGVLPRSTRTDTETPWLPGAAPGSRLAVIGARAAALAATLRAAIEALARHDVAGFGSIYAYEIDGCGGFSVADDSNDGEMELCIKNLKLIVINWFLGTDCVDLIKRCAQDANIFLCRL
jgi:hypothetical protein